MRLRNGEAGRGKRLGSPQKEPWAAAAPPGAVAGGTSGWTAAEAVGEGRASFRGVTRLERERKWVARVWNGQKQLTLGRFDTDVAAAQVGPMHPSRASSTILLGATVFLHSRLSCHYWKVRC